jgi:DNA-binding CsgD family transcriptional regulator
MLPSRAADIGEETMRTVPPLAELIEQIYAGIDDDAAWSRAFTRVADTLGAAKAGVGVQDMATHAFRPLASVRVEPQFSRRYRDEVAPSNLIWQEIARRRNPAVVTDRMLMPKDRFRAEQPLYGWFEDQELDGVMVAPVLKEGPRSTVVVMFSGRTEGDFGEEQIGRLAALAPHLRTAVRLKLRLAEAEAGRDWLAQSLDRLADAVLVVDAELRVLATNRAGEELLRARDVLRVGRGAGPVECVDDPNATDRLRTLVSDAGESNGAGADGTMALHRRCEDGRPPLAVTVVPLRGSAASWARRRAAAALFVHDPAALTAPVPAKLLRDLYGLTNAEARTVFAVLEAGSLEQAAEHLKKNPHTMHTHLQHAFDKTGAHGQRELSRLLLRLAASLRSR